MFTPEFIESLKVMAKRDTYTSNENFNAYDTFIGVDGGAAYWSGNEDGETDLARKVLSFLGISYE